MTILLVALLCAVLVEVGIRLPFAPLAARLGASGQKAVRTVRAPRVSDHWKEKAMGAYARRTFAATAGLAGLLALLGGIALVLTLGFERLADGFQDYLLSWQGILLSLVAATAYYYARRRLIG